MWIMKSGSRTRRTGLLLDQFLLGFRDGALPAPENMTPTACGKREGHLSKKYARQNERGSD